MGKTTGAHLRAQVLRPHGHLLRQTTPSILAFFAPVFAVLYWLTIPLGEWGNVAVALAGDERLRTALRRQADALGSV